MRLGLSAGKDTGDQDGLHHSDPRIIVMQKKKIDTQNLARTMLRLLFQPVIRMRYMSGTNSKKIPAMVTGINSEELVDIPICIRFSIKYSVDVIITISHFVLGPRSIISIVCWS